MNSPLITSVQDCEISLPYKTKAKSNIVTGSRNILKMQLTEYKCRASNDLLRITSDPQSMITVSGSSLVSVVVLLTQP